MKWRKSKRFHSGLQVRMHIWKLLFLFLNQNICCGCSKEPSNWDCSFEHPKHMFRLIGMKIIIILCLTLKGSITITADDKFCDSFPNLIFKNIKVWYFSRWFSWNIMLYCYLWKSSKIWNCRPMQIIGGALWVKKYLFGPMFTVPCQSLEFSVTMARHFFLMDSGPRNISPYLQMSYSPPRVQLSANRKNTTNYVTLENNIEWFPRYSKV